TSYYSKVEKNIHRITAEDLLSLFRANNVNLLAFFSKLSWSDKAKYDQNEEVGQLINEAYYQRDVERLQSLRRSVEKMGGVNMNIQLLLIDEAIADITDDFSMLGAEGLQKLKELIFSSDNLDEKRLRLYTNLVPYFDFESNVVLARRVINQFGQSQSTSIQEAVLGICANILIECIEKDRYEKAGPFIEAAGKIPTRQELFFIKNMLVILQNMVAYHDDKQAEHLAQAQRAIANYALLGMPEYGQEGQKFFDQYKEQ
ncbi:hypothetical protein EQ500_02630, partial [Lactobacillus sp. XV13L]|nr:hypothetical protein [Lactobacillus sp. XV13L]